MDTKEVFVVVKDLTELGCGEFEIICIYDSYQKAILYIACELEEIKVRQSKCIKTNTSFQDQYVTYRIFNGIVNNINTNERIYLDDEINKIKEMPEFQNFKASLEIKYPGLTLEEIQKQGDDAEQKQWREEYQKKKQEVLDKKDNKDTLSEDDIVMLREIAMVEQDMKLRSWLTENGY